MRIPTIQTAVVCAFALLLLPLLKPWLKIEPESLSYLGTLAAQMSTCLVLFVVAKRTASRALQVFWQYLAFAILLLFASTALFNEPSSLPDYLINQFVLLFAYFFVFLAIETNPHISDIPINKYISGRVPAVLFTLASFTYFVLIPLESVGHFDEVDDAQQMFHVLLTSIISIKVVWCCLYCQTRIWRLGFALLSLAALLSLTNLVNLGSREATSTIFYWTSVLPYLAIMIAAVLLSKVKAPDSAARLEVRHEAHILLLILIFIGLHVYGRELALFYLVDPISQSIVALTWAVLGALMVLIIAHNKRQHAAQVKTDLNKAQSELEQLVNLNDQLESNLLNSEEKAIVGVSNNAILTTSIEGLVLSANPAAVQMFQCLETDLLGTKVSHLFSAQDEMHFFFDFESNVYSLQRKESGISVECTSVRTDGTEFPAQAELQWAERQQVPLIVITFINLSARKLAEKQALELKDKFIANISHEFRTPLTIINGIIDGYLGHTTDQNEISDLTTAKRNGLRLVRMVEQLLELSRLSDNPKLNLATYQLHTLMSMPIDSFQRLAEQSQLSFASEIPEQAWLECDPQAFEKIIFNLLANAVKYTQAGGQIQVVAYLEQDSIILDVIDSGIGISKENQDKIFERFQRADDPNNQSVFGVGIGLSLVNELVKAHGWRISLASDPGHGSKFSLSMPLAKAQEVEAELPLGLTDNDVSSLLSQQVKVENTESVTPNQVVLVIEDNADMQSHIKQVVEQQHHCILAGSGELGLKLAQEYIPDLIVCDLMLTGIDGFEVLRQVKSNELTAHIPVILLTARSDLESRLQGLNLNADEYLSKPFNQHELLTRIQNLIENRHQLQQRYLAMFNKEQKSERREVSHNKVAQMTQAEPQPSLDDKFLSKLEKLIAQHYTETSLDISFLASELAMSERQLQRKMKVMLDTTPNNFIKEFRLKKALELLKSGAQIGRIALDVGFSSQTYFGRCFKESYGCTPKQYQQRLSEEDE